MKTRLLIIIVIGIIGITSVGLLITIDYRDSATGKINNSAEEAIQSILDSCNDTNPYFGNSVGLIFFNETHIIDDTRCEWKTIDRPLNADRTAMLEMGYELTGSLAIPNESRDSMLAKGYELYPGGWVHKDGIKADPVWIEHPNGSGEMILNLDAMKKQYEELLSDKEDKPEPISIAVCIDKCHEVIHELIEIVFGDARKSWINYPGGAGPTPPYNSTLTPIRITEAHFGIAPLDFEAMLDDKIFVNKCESNGGRWDYNYHDCKGIYEICEDVGGVRLVRDMTPPCIISDVNNENSSTISVCRGSMTIHFSCVFPYEN